MDARHPEADTATIFADNAELMLRMISSSGALADMPDGVQVAVFIFNDKCSGMATSATNEETAHFIAKLRGDIHAVALNAHPKA